MYMSKYMYNGIYIYVHGEGGLGSEKIWGATVDKWEGKIGSKFFFVFFQFFTIFFEKKRKKTKTLSEKLGPENCMEEKFSLRERRGAAHLQRGRTEGWAGGRAGGAAHLQRGRTEGRAVGILLSVGRASL